MFQQVSVYGNSSYFQQFDTSNMQPDQMTPLTYPYQMHVLPVHYKPMQLTTYFDNLYRFNCPQYCVPQLTPYTTPHQTNTSNVMQSHVTSTLVINEPQQLGDTCCADDHADCDTIGPGPPIVTSERMKGPPGSNVFVFHLLNDYSNW
jgi:hypothetical protein